MPWLPQLPKLPLLQGYATRKGDSPQGLVVHYSVGGRDVAGLHRYFADRADRSRDNYRSASYHGATGRHGISAQFRDTDSQAWHAGGRKSHAYNCEIPTPGLVNQQTIGWCLTNWGWMSYATALRRGFRPKRDCLFARPENGGKLRYWERYPDEQIDAFCECVLLLREVHDLQWISGHSDHVKEKSDPSPAFPWEAVCSYVGLPRARHDWRKGEWVIDHA